jgi:hypothetical protein
MCVFGGKSSALNGDMVVPILTNVELGCTVNRANVIVLDIRSARSLVLLNAHAMLVAVRSGTVADWYHDRRKATVGVLFGSLVRSCHYFESIRQRRIATVRLLARPGQTMISSSASLTVDLSIPVGTGMSGAVILDAAGLPHSRVHDGRHTAGTLLIDQDVHLRVVQEILATPTFGSLRGTPTSVPLLLVTLPTGSGPHCGPRTDTHELQPQLQPSPDPDGRWFMDPPRSVGGAA